ncbi:MAG: hypothetical protein WA655_01815 [Candidatus Korobacteraceae bacterium]
MSNASQYSYPTPGDSVSLREVVPAYTLYDWVSVGIAAFLGTLVGGTALMALNYRRLGKQREAIWALALGVFATACAFAVGPWLPSWAPGVVAIGLFVGTMNSAKVLQSAAVGRHVSSGGALGSRWIAFGLGVALMAITFGGVFLFVSARELGAKFVVGSNDAVYYSGSATRDDARQLADALKAVGYLSDRGANVLLSKGKDGTVVSFVVQNGIWDQPQMVAGFQEIGREIALRTGGFPIKLRLVNTDRTPMKEITEGRIAIGTKDEIYYYSPATESDARKLAESLKSAGYFQDRGVSVFLSKEDGSPVVSFVVAEGVWDDPQSVASYEDHVRRAVVPVLGRPITLRLVNSGLETKKSEIVR